MGTETLFYWFGGLFAIAAIVYFTWEYIISFPDSIKTVLLACLAVAFFFAGNLLREKDI
ncbi:MAG: hypothetical protein H6502_02240 [Candidatus Woesearchaeota archaeon]|nr:MAG: hypothetical protein H6502_02240 [Candidatus Woesearchaeota archaeon]